MREVANIVHAHQSHHTHCTRILNYRALQLEEAREAREAANVVLARKEEEKQRQLQAFREKKQQVRQVDCRGTREQPLD